MKIWHFSNICSVRLFVVLPFWSIPPYTDAFGFDDWLAADSAAALSRTLFQEVWSREVHLPPPFFVVPCGFTEHTSYLPTGHAGWVIVCSCPTGSLEYTRLKKKEVELTLSIFHNSRNWQFPSHWSGMTASKMMLRIMGVLRGNQ